jgi:hypothetical protein
MKIIRFNNMIVIKINAYKLIINELNFLIIISIK